ncbi:hypothetical protein VZC37_13445 [Gordonia sp. LSe1-13]|uniref:Uncharacterized protein n=1 Tax=Gordonia sesuvii TaxID=3116777 RepID=A0ABU7ME13_9ACTN|nr:hypothetical protein [Gordonia sp. LSe1-13]
MRPQWNGVGNRQRGGTKFFGGPRCHRELEDNFVTVTGSTQVCTKCCDDQGRNNCRRLRRAVAEVFQRGVTDTPGHLPTDRVRRAVPMRQRLTNSDARQRLSPIAAIDNEAIRRTVSSICPGREI